jgi:predicted TIM-barrel fold metal-dependent hydrolase
MARNCVALLAVGLFACRSPQGTGTRSTETYRILKASLDAVPAIDTHDHLYPWERNTAFLETDQGRGVNLASLWLFSYFGWTNRLTSWKPGDSFDHWWAKAKNDFENARATSMYRYQLPAFVDLYGVDFDHLSDDQARELNDRIFQNYKDPKWLTHVITERANIELMFNDPFWARLGTGTTWPFEVFVFNVTSLVRGFHPSEYGPKAVYQESDNPYALAKELGVEVRSLDDYLTLLDRLFARAKKAGAACLKTTLAYQRTLRFDKVARERAEQAFGKPASELSPDDVKAFEDFIMWRLCELSAKYDLPFQIHTGHARIEGSSPLNLLDMIAGNPGTKFILFHGGYPWISETAAVAAQNTRIRSAKNVWVDSVWLPTISYSAAKRAYHEFLDTIPSDKIMWGADCTHAEGIYGATETTRRCLAEVLAERVDAGNLRLEDAERIGRQILRDNALKLFPSLKDRLWKHRGTPPETPTSAAGGSKEAIPDDR